MNYHILECIKMYYIACLNYKALMRQNPYLKNKFCMNAERTLDLI